MSRIEEYEKRVRSPYDGPRISGYEFIGNSGRATEQEAIAAYASILHCSYGELVALTSHVSGIKWHVYRSTAQAQEDV